MTIKYYDFEQNTPEWYDARLGILTASQMHLIITPSLKIADNDKSRGLVWEIAAQRINKYVEPTFIGDNAIRGHTDEILARDLYSEKYEPIEQVGFITRDIDGIIIGYSPDGCAVMSHGGIEAKSRKQKFQVETIATNKVPQEHILQVQTAMFVTDWEWIDYISYCGGMPMWVIRVLPDQSYQTSILTALIAFEAKVRDIIDQYYKRLDCVNVIETVRVETLDLNDGEYE